MGWVYLGGTAGTCREGSGGRGGFENPAFVVFLKP